MSGGLEGSATSRWQWKNHGHVYHKDEENNQGSHRGWMWGADRGLLEDDKEWFKMIANSRECDLSMCYSIIKITFQTSDSEVGEEISTNRSLRHVKPTEFNSRSYCQPSGSSSFFQISPGRWVVLVCVCLVWAHHFSSVIHVSYKLSQVAGSLTSAEKVPIWRIRVDFFVLFCFVLQTVLKCYWGLTDIPNGQYSPHHKKATFMCLLNL